MQVVGCVVKAGNTLVASRGGYEAGLAIYRTQRLAAGTCVRESAPGHTGQGR